jgi:adenosylcobyric acid synthase
MCTAICAWLSRRGVRVAPFKAQNMSNNSYPCAGGGEIGRAQVAQAQACGLEPEPAMNPILLKPTSSTGSQVIVNGKLWKTLPARGYYQHFGELVGVVADAHESLARRFEFIVIEGAGSVAELNLRGYDLVNLGLAAWVGAPALIVADIERGGVFASVLGSLDLLEAEERKLVRSFAVNKFRGDLSLFDDGRRILEERSGLPCLGVFPYAEGIELDDEDSLSVPRAAAGTGGTCAVVRFPRISNSTDVQRISGACWIDRPAEGRFDVVILPGSKSTIADLRWMRERGLDEWVLRQERAGARIVGVCGGYQMLGRAIRDPEGVEGAPETAEGLGLLPVETTMAAEKTVRRVSGVTAEGVVVEGYEIHMGQSRATEAVEPLFTLEDGEREGVRRERVFGGYLHGALESPEFLRRVLGLEAADSARSESFERLADWFEAHATGFADLYL